MTEFNRDPLDGLIEAALNARPEEASRGDLAVMALARVLEADARSAALRRIGRWIGLCGLAAGLLVILVLALGAYQYSATGGSDTSEIAVESVDNGSTSLNTSVDTTALAVLVMAMVAVTVTTVMTPEREDLRFAAA